MYTEPNAESNFNVYSKSLVPGLSRALKQAIGSRPAVFVCVGSDAVAGDSLSPLVGSFLKEFYRLPCFVYGELKHTVTAKEVPVLANSIRALHPGALVVAIDASLGAESEVGLIKLREGGLFPGKGVGKRLPEIGDISLLGVVSTRGESAFRGLELTRYGLVYRMASAISQAIYLAMLPIGRKKEFPAEQNGSPARRRNIGLPIEGNFGFFEEEDFRLRAGRSAGLSAEENARLSAGASVDFWTGRGAGSCANGNIGFSTKE